jgi:cell division protein FtsN
MFEHIIRSMAVTKYLKTTLLLIALSLAGCAARPTHDQTLNEQGLNAMQAGNMEEAERLFTEAVQENPHNLQTLFNLASLYQNTNRPEQAREYYQRVIDGENSAKDYGQDPDEAARLAQAARDNIALLDQEEALRQEAKRKEAEEAERAARAAVIPPPVQPQPVPAPVVEEGGYRVQTGAFAITANAESMQARLVRRHASLIKSKKVHLVKVNGLTKVQIGPYTTRDAASNACRDLKRVGVSCFLRVNK